MQSDMVITHLPAAERSLVQGASEDLRLVDETLATSVALQLVLGRLYYKRGKLKKSIRHLEEGIKGAEQLEDSRLLSLGYSSLGDVYYREGRRDEARAAYQRAIVLESVSPVPMSRAGTSDTLEGLEDPSLSFQRAVEIDPDNVWSYYGLGVVCGRKGNYAAAVAKFIECVEINPRFMPARLQLAAIYYEQGNYRAAVSEYQRAIEICRMDDELLPDLYFGMGDAYRAQAEYGLAVASYQRAINALRSSLVRTRAAP
jgi:tetratricopeptide (TPR) repeat protein